ncbi:hypothetical protein L226DRAFT_561383 [Lentinus tigrinus ALCF2SS1-7]|uniref:uncharacterized protein n=1 Tax=Lentinus tigrinus ALCF2SS1-7 TaxID=1328758 RepID=UPI0011661ABE|nr:hypothetical protein L226DRAFT_561383 [Lentinus tigrinus ALCF2SS1-7]
MQNLQLITWAVLCLATSLLYASSAIYGYGLSGRNFPPFGCLQTDFMAKEIQLSLLIYITWTNLSSRDVLRGLRQSKRLPLSDILLRDGTIYFLVMFILNVLHLTFSATALVSGIKGSYITVFTSPITAILVSRFLLELQEAGQRIVRVDSDDPLHISMNPYDDTPSFIRSLGAVIDPTLPRDGDRLSGAPKELRWISSPIVAAWYDSDPDPDAFWQCVCWKNGIGLITQLDKPDSDTCWRDIAIGCIESDGHCLRPGCGRTLLLINSRSMRSGYIVSDPITNWDRVPRLALHPVLQGITFEGVPWIQDVLRDARLSTTTREEKQYAFRNTIHLGCHLLAYRSFASFPPVKRLNLSPPKGLKLAREVVENSFGVTVYDILRVLHDSLDIPLDMEEFEQHRWDYTHNCPPGMHNDTLKTLRDLLSFKPIREIVQERKTDRAVLRFCF